MPLIQPYATAYWQRRQGEWHNPLITLLSWVQRVRGAIARLLANCTRPCLNTILHQQDHIIPLLPTHAPLPARRLMDQETLNALEGKSRSPSPPVQRGGGNGSDITSGVSKPALPAEHLPAPSSLAQSTDSAVAKKSNISTGTATRPQHSNSVSAAPTPSLADVARQTKRLSLNFPPPTFRDNSNSRSPRPLSFVGSPVLSPIQAVPSPERELVEDPLASTKNTFLTHIAAQERRVLELKEELGRAERELEKLKKQWAQHEVQRKKQDAKRTTQLKPLQIAPSTAVLDTGTDTEEVMDGNSMLMQQEMERRKRMMSGVQRSNRRVFSSSRHARTLSLLSPERTQAPSFPQPRGLTEDSAPAASTATVAHVKSGSVPIVSTTVAEPEGLPPPPIRLRQPDGAAAFTSASASKPNMDLARLPGDMLLETGKQMATDLKDGLWMFFEDIRQATVGEEAVSGNPTRRMQNGHGHVRSKTSTQSLRRHGSHQSLDRTSPGPIESSGNANGPRREGRSPAKYRHRQQRPMSDVFDIIGGDFWTANGIDDSIGAHVVHPPTKRAAKTHARASAGRTPIKEETTRPVSRDSEAWDTWDTPNTKTANGSNALAASPAADSVSSVEGSIKSTPRTSTSSVGFGSTATATTTTAPPARKASTSKEASNKDAIPWPALSKLAPSQLKRTASNLMKEWEQSMGPGSSPRRSPLVPGGVGGDYFDGGL